MDRAKTREDTGPLHAWTGRKKPSTNSPIGAKTQRPVKIIRSSSSQASKTPWRLPRGARVGRANHHSGTLCPPNNSLYELYPLVGVKENEITPDTFLANQSATRLRSSLIISRLSFAPKVSEALKRLSVRSDYQRLPRAGSLLIFIHSSVKSAPPLVAGASFDFLFAFKYRPYHIDPSFA